MFDIFVKRSTITVDCFTHNSAIHKFFPIMLANEAFPEWWKSMKATIPIDRYGIKHDSATIKRCDGLNGLYQHGIVIPLWSDLILETNNEGGYRYLYSSEENAPITCHSKAQFNNHFDNLVHVKIQSPWLIEEKTGVKFHYGQAAWSLLNYSADLNIVPAIINFKDQLGSHINLFMPRKENRIELSASQPLVHIIPLSDKKIILKNHLISKEEHDQKHLSFSYMSNFLGRYKKNVKKVTK